MGQHSSQGTVLAFPLPPPEGLTTQAPPPAAPKRQAKASAASAAPTGSRLPIPSWPSSEKPRERLLRLGTDALSDAELLALLLRTGEGAGRGTALDQARSLLSHFTGPEGLARATAAEFCRLPGMGPAKACGIAAAFALAGRGGAAAPTANAAIGCSEDVFRRMGARLSTKRSEEFWVLLLNTKNHLLREVQVSLGSLANAQVHPREVFGAAVREGAASVIFVHNHPSGDPTPSAADKQLTRRLQEGAQLLGISVLDHIVMGRHAWESFADRGWL